MSPSYFVFEMESIRCVTIAISLEYFKKARRKLIIESTVIASILVSFSCGAAFLNAFFEDKIGNGSASYQRGLYLFGAVL